MSAPAARRVYISATYKEFSAYREISATVCHRLDITPVLFEESHVTGQDLVRSMYSLIDECELFVGLIGTYYGSSPAGIDLSYVEMEHRHALSQGIACILFIGDENPSLADTDERRRESAKRFRQEMSKAQPVERIVSPTDFEEKLEGALRRRMEPAATLDLMDNMATDLPSNKGDVRQSAPNAPNAAPHKTAKAARKTTRNGPAAVESKTAAPPDLTKDLTEPGQRILQYAAALTQLPSRKTTQIDSTLLLAGYLVQADQNSDSQTASFLREFLASASHISDTNALLSKLLGADAPSRVEPIELAREMLTHTEIEPIFRGSSELARGVIGGRYVYPRHLLGSLLAGGRPRQTLTVEQALQKIGCDPSDLRLSFLEFVRKQYSREKQDGWADFLAEVAPVTEPAQTEEEGLLAGINADVVDGIDALGIEQDVNALCSVIAAEGTSPPLSIGLFGDWGSGKSFFMEKMRARTRQIYRKSRAARMRDEPSAYCAHIVQITFNAWHYTDANLWASLVSRVFEELSVAISKDQPDADQEALIRKLQGTEKDLADKEQELAAAEGGHAEAERKLHQVEEERKRADDTLSSVRAEDLAREILDHTAEGAQLRAASADLGLSAVHVLEDDVQAVIREAVSVAGRARLVARSFVGPAGKKRAAIILILVVAPPVIALALPYYAGWLHGAAQWLVGIGAPAVTALTGFVKYVRPVLKKASEGVGRLESSSKKVREMATASFDERVKNLEAEVARRKAEEENARNELVEARAEADRLRQEVEAAQKPILARERMRTLVLERSAGKEYAKHLGIIASIRSDFERLSSLLEEARHEEADHYMPRIDRIILYIDDLDRCPANKVVDVLQAVHLLLAFPLFVVVVGVDSRWLLNALRRHYAEFLTGKQDEDSRENGPDDEDDWESTPQNYLEKIFQIPLTLKKMDREGFGRLLDNLVVVRKDEIATADKEADAPAPSELPHGDQVSKAPSRRPAGEITAAGASQLHTGRSKTEIPHTRIQDRTAQRPVETDDLNVNIDMTPQSLLIEEFELTFMQELAPFIPSPRAAKRFVNIYRLIRASVDKSDLPSFVGSREKPGTHRAALLLLAVLTGYPAQASCLLAGILEVSDSHPWWEFVETLRPVAAASSLGAHGANGVDDEIDERDMLAWNELYGRLLLLKRIEPHVIPDRVQPYKEWAPVVARFSFQAGRAVTAKRPSSASEQTAAEAVVRTGVDAPEGKIA